MTDKPLPLTMNGLDVALQQFEESLRGVGDDATSDPTAIREWAERTLRAGGWDIVDEAVAVCRDAFENRPAWRGDPELNHIVVRGSAALTDRLDGMPQSLEDALKDGWVKVEGWPLNDPVFERFLMVWDGARWQEMHLIADGRGWTPAVLRGPPVPWRELSPVEREAVLDEMPDVLAWKTSGGRGPWEQAPRMTVQEAFERLGVQWMDANGEPRDSSTLIAEVVAALDLAEGEERRRIVRALGGEWGEAEPPDLTAFATFLRETVPESRLGAERVARALGEWVDQEPPVRRGDFISIGPDGRPRRAEEGAEVVGVAQQDADRDGCFRITTSGVATLGVATPDDAHRENGDHRIGEEWVTEVELVDLARQMNMAPNVLLQWVETTPSVLQYLRGRFTDTEQATEAP